MLISGRVLAISLLSAAFTFANAAVVCTPSAVPALVRAEGLTEAVGDILLSCAGAPGDTLNGNLTVFLPVNVTNRLSDSGTLDAVLTADTGSGPAVVPGVSAVLVGNTGVGFTGIALPLPSGRITLRISNLRGAMAQLAASNPVVALLSITGSQGVALTSANVIVGLPMRGLLAGSNAGSVNCYGSPLPSTINLTNLFAAGTRVFSSRVTEGFPNAFEKKGPNADTGIRIVVRYANFPQGARLFVPDVLAGSGAIQPTAGGDLILPPAGGQYAPTASGSLLLARVNNANADGTAGLPVFIPGPPGSPAVAFDSVFEVPLAAGSGFVVYEVVDANPIVQERAQIPTFLGFPATSDLITGGATETVLLGPVSTVATATAKDPVPRFAPLTPPPDCTLSGDCSAFPKLFVNAPKPFRFTAEAGGKKQSEFASVENLGGGNLAWTATISYKSGSGWASLRAEPNRGPFAGWFRVDVDPSKLAPGVYEATLTIDAGTTAGSQTLPITLTVTAPAPVPPAVQLAQVNAVVNAASFLPGPLVPGSLATLIGSRFAGKSVSVTFDGIAAKLLYTSDTQINLLVPAELGARPSAQLVVTVDGNAGAPRTVQLTQISPAIFANGILNQDNFVNAPANPAPVGSVVQIFATGLPAADAGTITAKIHDREIASPDYAGPAPTLFGVQQVNITIPADLPPMTTEVLVCGTSLSTGQKVCSPPAKISLRQ